MEALSQRFSEEDIADYTPAEFLDELLNTDAVPRMTDAEDETKCDSFLLHPGPLRRKSCKAGPEPRRHGREAPAVGRDGDA